MGDKGRSYGAAMADAEPLIDYVKAQLQEAVDGDDGSKRGVQEVGVGLVWQGVGAWG